MSNKRRDARVSRARRQGGVHNILLMNLARDVVVLGDRTLSEYFSLKVVQISDKVQGAIPTVLQHLMYKHYNIGPSGCLIGTAPHCHIKLPSQALTADVHAEVVWRQEKRCFELHDRAGKMVNEQQKELTFPLELAHGQEFLTGRVVWKVIALPSDVVFNLKLFAAARSKDLTLLKQQIEAEEEASARRHSSEERRFSVVEYLQVARSDQKSQPVLTEGIDINIVDDPDTSYHGNTAPPTAKTLLHVAIENNDRDMIRYLLDKGADVNKCVGVMGLSSLHIAASCNNDEAMEMLLTAGGDVEIQDNDCNIALSWTTSYKIRCMILNTMLLCCAAYEGDTSVVTHLLTTTQASPNALGLKHKNALHHAAYAGHEPIVKLLLDNGAKVNAVGGSRDRTPLHYASIAGHVGVAKILKKANADLTLKDRDGYTAINLTKGGEICEVLHQGPVDLCEAVRRGDIEDARKLLDNNHHNVDQRNEQGHAPLHIACVLKYTDLVKLLIEHGADVNIIGGSNQWTPLFYAAQSGHVTAVELLLHTGADAQVMDIEGKTVRQVIENTMDELTKRLERPEVPLISIIEEPQTLPVAPSMEPTSHSVLNSRLSQLHEVLNLLNSPAEKLLLALDKKDLLAFEKLLVDNTDLSNVVMDTDEHDRMSILCMACEMGAYAFVELLLKHGAKIQTSGELGEVSQMLAEPIRLIPSEDAIENNCPLHISCYNGHTDVVMLLVNDPSIKINQQATDTLSTALHVAASENFLDVTELLLKAGVDRTITNARGEKPYDCARLDDIKRLLATGANELHYNASKGNEQIVCQLLEQTQIAVDAESYHGNTALHEASRCGHRGVVQQLINCKANINKKNGQSGSTPLHLASASDHIKVVELLLSVGAKRDIKDNEGKVPFEVACSHQMRKVLIKQIIAPNLNPVLSRPSLTANLCCICYDRNIDTILKPCNHERLCMVCVEKIRLSNNKCPLDKQIIMEVIRVNT